MRLVAITLLTISALLAAACGGEINVESATGTELPVPSTSGSDVAAKDGVDDGGEIGDRGDIDDEDDIDDLTPAESSTSGNGSVATDSAVPNNSKALVLAAVEKSATGHDSVRMTMTMVVGGVPDLGGGEAALVIEAAVADGGRSSAFSMDMSGFIDAALADPDLDPLEAELMRSVFGQPLEFRVIGDTTYVSASLLSFFVPAETAWIAFESDQPADGFGVSDMTSDPADFLALLRGIDDGAEIVGTEEIDGVSTTHVHGSLSVLDAIAAAPNAERASVQEAIAGLDPSDVVDVSVDLFDIDLWIDDDGLVRRMVLAVDDLAAIDDTGETPDGAYLRLILDFTDYGEDIVVEEPAADEVTFIDEASFGFGG